MMSLIPEGVLKLGVVSVVLNDLVFRDSEASPISIFTIGKLKDVLYILASQRAITAISSDWRSQATEYHNVLP